jgi:hypothetical protein
VVLCTRGGYQRIRRLMCHEPSPRQAESGSALTGSLRVERPPLERKCLAAQVLKTSCFSSDRSATSVSSSRVGVRCPRRRGGWGRRVSPRRPRGGCGLCPLTDGLVLRSPRPGARRRRVRRRRPLAASRGLSPALIASAASSGSTYRPPRCTVRTTSDRTAALTVFGRSRARPPRAPASDARRGRGRSR